MGKSSKSKGKRGELELVHELKRLGFHDAHRSQQFCGSASSADLVGIPGIHIECKRTETLSLYKAYNQALKDSVGSTNIPTVFHRRNNQPWLVVMSINDWAKIYHGYMCTNGIKSLNYG